jgi:hypothetical protein
MGFPLPVFGYVAQRGHYDIHDRSDEDGTWNARNKRSVENFMDGIRDIYPRCPAPGKFVFPWGSDDPLVFGGVHFETDNDERPVLHTLLHRLQDGGTIVVTDLEHLVTVDNERAVQLMLDYDGERTAFLDINQSRVRRVATLRDIDYLIGHVLKNHARVSNLVRRRANALNLRPREKTAPRLIELA